MSKLIKHLGKIDTKIVGINYYQHEIGFGDEVLFSRNPSNEHDEKAIEVVNKNCETVGHLPREYSAFLAPLLDNKMIKLEGFSLDSAEEWCIPLGLTIFLTKKGKKILSSSKLDDPAYIIHNQVSDFFQKSSAYSAKTIASVKETYDQLISENSLPQTILLYHLLDWKKEEACKREAEEQSRGLQDNLSQMSLGDAVSHNNISIIPIYSPVAGSLKYKISGPALKGQSMEITEMDEGGCVPRLKMKNKNIFPVLFLSGEELIGGKQNRIFNLSVLATPMAETIIPVSCVEQGRWAHNSKQFTKGRRANASLRQVVIETVRKNIVDDGQFNTDQNAVWSEVSNLQEDLSIESETEAMNDGYKEIDKRITDIKKHLKYPVGSSGFAVFINGDFGGIELFGHPDVLKKNWKSQIESYAVEAVRGECDNQHVFPLENSVLEVVGKVIKNLESPRKSPGLGYDIGISGEGITGAALVENKRLIHLNVFCNN
jgi:hypothetical protein